MRALPRRSSPLQDILRLFPHLLDAGLQCNDVRRHRSVLHLGTDRVGLACHLLEQEVDALPDRCARILDQFEHLIAVLADRSDIAEEIVRLKSHLEQFENSIELPESAGRKLDFITQEMGRETNTIGSKAADAEVSAHVVEIKCAIERMRELVQNLE